MHSGHGPRHAPLEIAPIRRDIAGLREFGCESLGDFAQGCLYSSRRR